MNTITVSNKVELLTAVAGLDYSVANVIRCGACTYRLPAQIEPRLEQSYRERKLRKINSTEAASEYRRKRMLTQIRKLPKEVFSV